MLTEEAVGTVLQSNPDQCGLGILVSVGLFEVPAEESVCIIILVSVGLWSKCQLRGSCDC